MPTLIALKKGIGGKVSYESFRIDDTILTWLHTNEDDNETYLYNA